MAVRPHVLAVATALLLAPLIAAQRAEAATVLGSTNLAEPHDGLACEGCVAGITLGLRQLALQGATVEAPEAGVLVSAAARLSRIGGSQLAQIAVLRRTDGITARVTGTASLPASSPDGTVERIGDLHLPVLPGDSLGLVLPVGEVDLGIRLRPRPDGAVVAFVLPCTLCGTDGGTGRELLFQGTVEPDVDEDLLGDESQDPDGGFAGDEGFFGDEDVLDEDGLDEELGLGDEVGLGEGGSARERRRLRLLRARAGRYGGATLLLATSGAGHLRAVATASPRRRARSRRTARARLTAIAMGRARATRAGRVRLRLRPGRIGRRLIARRGRLRTRLEVRFDPRRGRAAMVTGALTLRMPPTRLPRR
jgi:hypothetical protein